MTETTARENRKRDQVRNALVEKNRNLAVSIARKHCAGGEELDDLIQVALYGLVKACERFDPSRGTRLSTYATPTIAGEVLRHFRDKTWNLAVPRPLKEQAISVSRVTAQLRGILNRAPTDLEVAAVLGIAEKQVEEARRVKASDKPLSLDSPRQPDHHLALEEWTGSQDLDPALLTESSAIWSLVEKLPEDEAQVITRVYRDEISQSQLARTLGLSSTEVSRIKIRGLRRLREMLEE